MLRWGQLDVRRLKHEFKKQSDLFAGMALVISPTVLPAILKKLDLTDEDIFVKVSESKSKMAVDKMKFKNYFGMAKRLSNFAHFQFLALLRGEKQKALSISWDFQGRKWNQRSKIISSEIAESYSKNFLPQNALMKEVTSHLEKKISSGEIKNVFYNHFGTLFFLETN